MGANTLETKIFTAYINGEPARSVADRFNLKYKAVNDMFFEWDLQKTQIKKEVEASKLMFPNFNRTPLCDFILCTNNNEVLTAYNKLINP